MNESTNFNRINCVFLTNRISFNKLGSRPFNWDGKSISLICYYQHVCQNSIVLSNVCINLYLWYLLKLIKIMRCWAILYNLQLGLAFFGALFQQDINPWHPYSKGQRLDHMEASNSPTQHGQHGFILDILWMIQTCIINPVHAYTLLNRLP